VNILRTKQGNIRKYTTFCGGINEDGERKNKKMYTSYGRVINPLALELDIYSLAHHLCKM
jgi:hypothetical protein